jgi:phage gp36-like protein
VPNPLALTLQAYGPQTTSGSSAVVDLLAPVFAEDGLKRRLAELMIEVTAISGVGATLKARVQTSPNTTSFRDVLAFPEFVELGFHKLCFSPLERYIRLAWDIGGATPSVTFTVYGDAHVIYASPDDFFRYGLPRQAAAPDDGTDPVDLLSAQLLAASSDANSKIPRAYTLPLKDPYPDSLKRRVCKIAAYYFLQQRGFDPESEPDKKVEDEHDAAWEWLDALGGGVEPDWVDATPDVYDAGAGTASGPRRDWGM